MTHRNKTILITGATNGIGRAAAMQLACMGHTIVIVGRNRQKCLATAETIRQQTGVIVNWLVADLSSQAQVRKLAQEFKRHFNRLDVLINNAGAVFIRRSETVDGMESCWSVNYLQAFLLTHLLLDHLKASAPARVINLSSVSHWAARLNLDNMQEHGLYIGWNVYARCKLASIYFTYELARRLEGSRVTANVIHPGVVRTGIGKTSGCLLHWVMSAVDLFAITPEKAAAGMVNLAANPAFDAVNGQYFSGMKKTRSSPVSYNCNIARQLWSISEKLTGISGNDS